AVERAARGQEALARLHDEDPELVILDLGLPDIDGSEVVRRYRASAGQVPVIILSARGDVGDRVAALELGADDYMCKPFAFDELAARIKGRLRAGDRSRILRAGRGPPRRPRAGAPAGRERTLSATSVCSRSRRA